MEIDQTAIPSLFLVEALRSTQPAHDPTSNQSHTASSPRVFTLFANLPPELRAPIWKHALPRRIIKWTRTNSVNTFSAPKNSTPLFEVCKESRETAMLYGEYMDISEPLASLIFKSRPDRPVFFSPIFDDLLFEPVWTDLITHPDAKIIPDPLDSLSADMRKMRSIMVHPNYTDERKRPTARFEKLPFLEQILVAADEKSVGSQSKFILGTIYDIKLYYEADVRKRLTNIERNLKTPYIAVGCLGWTGIERRKMIHGKQDARELVAVFENEAQMKVHSVAVKEAEWRFTQELQLKRPVLKLNFKHVERKGFGKDEQQVEVKNENGDTLAEPPNYSQGSSKVQERPPPYVETEEVMRN